MNNSEKGDFYFGISDNKIYICFLKKENKSIQILLSSRFPII